MVEVWKGVCLVIVIVLGCDGVLVGIVFMILEKGDKIFVFFGGLIFVVMRDLGEGDGSYKVIGFCLCG